MISKVTFENQVTGRMFGAGVLTDTTENRIINPNVSDPPLGLNNETWPMTTVVRLRHQLIQSTCRGQRVAREARSGLPMVTLSYYHDVRRPLYRVG